MVRGASALVFGAAIFVLAACEPIVPLTDRSGVRIATDAEVANCQILRVVTTTLGVSGTIADDRALELARNETLQNVRELGGDTAVFESGGPGSQDLFVRARAYRCGF